MFPPNMNLNNISPQQAQQMVFLQQMRQGMGSGPAAVAGGTGMGPGGYAVTQQGYAASDKMRMSQAQIMASMGMPGGKGGPQQQMAVMGQDGRPIAQPQPIASPAMNPQQMMQQQQQFAGSQGGGGGMPNPFQLSQMQQRQQGSAQSPPGTMNPQQFQMAMSMGGGGNGGGGGWNPQAGSPINATGGGWQVGMNGNGDPSLAGGFPGMTVPGDMGASAGGGESVGVDPVSLYTNW